VYTVFAQLGLMIPRTPRTTRATPRPSSLTKGLSRLPPTYLIDIERHTHTHAPNREPMFPFLPLNMKSMKSGSLIMPIRSANRHESALLPPPPRGVKVALTRQRCAHPPSPWVLEGNNLAEGTIWLGETPSSHGQIAAYFFLACWSISMALTPMRSVSWHASK